MILYRILNKKYPFFSKSTCHLLKNILEKKVDFPDSMNVKHIIILQKMLNKNPLRRPYVSQILKWVNE